MIFTEMGKDSEAHNYLISKRGKKSSFVLAIKVGCLLHTQMDILSHLVMYTCLKSEGRGAGWENSGPG